MKIRLAVILPSCDFVNRRGLMNAALCRLEQLERMPEYDIDVYALKTEYRQYRFGDLCRGEISCMDIHVDGRVIHQLTKVEYRSSNRLLRKPLKLYHRYARQRLCDWEWQKRFAKYVKGYDAVTVHFNDAAIIAESVHGRFGTPYFVTWHGSDIHTIPFNDPAAKEKTIQCIEHAACNFFVSKALLEISDRLTKNGKKEVLYNGVDGQFIKYELLKRERLRQNLGVEDVKVITFVGNLRSVKNADKLPDIFEKIQEGCAGKVFFWIIGDGDQKSAIEAKLSRMNIDCVLWGNQPHESIPDFLNCTDILILPSKNEGLPLVTLEALSCGANVVGSMVGGIPEAIGDDFCVPIDGSFVDSFAQKVIEVLQIHPIQPLKGCFSWRNTATKEKSIYFQMVNNIRQKE